MKKTIIIFSIIIFIIVLNITLLLIKNNKNLLDLEKYNKEYEQYYQKIVYGTDVITLINKSTNANEKNNIEKDENGLFIDNGINSIKIDLKLLYDGELTTYSMENLTKVGLDGFVRSFNLTRFKCTDIQYHENTKKVKKIVFEQIEE